MPSYQSDSGRFGIELTSELRQYIAACVLAARTSDSRTEALKALGVLVEDAWELAGDPVDWAELEREAERQGCTVADVIYDRTGR